MGWEVARISMSRMFIAFFGSVGDFFLGKISGNFLHHFLVFSQFETHL